MGLGTESGRMNVRAGARQQYTVHHLQEGVDVREVRRTCKDQRQRAGGFYHGAKISLSHLLNGEAVLDAMRVGNHADHGFLHRPTLMSSPACRQTPRRVAPTPAKGAGAAWRS